MGVTRKGMVAGDTGGTCASQHQSVNTPASLELFTAAMHLVWQHISAGILNTADYAAPLEDELRRRLQDLHHIGLRSTITMAPAMSTCVKRHR